MRRFILRIMRIELRQIGTKNKAIQGFFFFIAEIFIVQKEKENVIYLQCVQMQERLVQLHLP